MQNIPNPKKKDFSSAAIRKLFREELAKHPELTQRVFTDLQKIKDPKDFIACFSKVLTFVLPPLQAVSEEAEGNYNHQPPKKYTLNVHSVDFSNAC